VAIVATILSDNGRFDSHGQPAVCPTILADDGRYDTYGQTAIVRESSVFCSFSRSKHASSQFE